MLDTEECFTLGADAVCTDSRELVQAHNAIVHHSVSGLECPLKHRLEREQVLRNLAGGALTVRSQQLRSHSNRLEQQLGRMRQHLEAFVQKSFVKVVHISDTHNLHRSLVLPKGDLLLHTGDWSGNYRAPYEINLLEQFRDFLEWIEQTACPDFEQVIILAGNHESYLDPAKQPAQYQEAMEILQSYLDRNPNLAYLDKSSVEYRGLVIYGTPTTICRVETQEKVMLSNGFERTLLERFYDFEQIPECDILLTHLPPAGLGLSLLQDSCPILTKAVYGRQGRKVPRLHAFGHIHSQFGIARESHTILSNACQENLLRVDVFGGGTPIVFDLPIE
jgi:Icc-related predicted phosphoesterase